MGERSKAFRKAGRNMTNDEIIQYYDYLMRLAASKCNSQLDAEDLVGDTMLAAFAYIHSGGTIQHPKTWLVNTLYHKHNDNLRKKYRSPITVCLDEGFDISEEETEEYLSSEEAAKIRKELNHLAYITREVMIRFYYGSQSVADIADGLNIPEGTVKSRLSTGRSQMKKGLETMETRENYLPGRLNLSFGGSDGLKGEPISLVEGDLIAQNLLILAYDKPITISDLSKAIGIPAAYIEPIVKKLIDGELMVQMDSGKVYSDFIISKAQDILKNFESQKNFAHKQFDTVWSIVEKMSAKISKMDFVKSMDGEERTKLDRYAVLKALQDFQHFGTGKIESPKFPKRKDGGWWFAQAIAFDAGYNTKEYMDASEYCIHGGHRTSEAVSVGRTKRIRLYEFDTTLWDSPHRFGGAYELYFKHIIPLLWSIYDGISLETSDIPNDFISYIPTLEQFGVIGRTEDKLCVKIPVLKKTDYDEMCALIKNATEEIKAVIGEEFTTFITSLKTLIPKHLTSVPELFRYMEATAYFVMSIVREAYDNGLHLKDVDYCCPPVVLVYEE
ncbi:MAG: sigma-70 family RNA polymerase sigma factor [Clostridia bacterium]|nr:sigma-70 family RNA polymerase sigma factor [Clostridia bacterium]